MSCAGVPIGEQYLKSHAGSCIEHVGTRMAAQLQARLQRAHLAGIGIPSDFEFCLDTATIGKIYNSVRSTVCLIGVTISQRDAPQWFTVNIH